MPSIVSKIKGKTLHSQTQEVIYNVMTFMEADSRNTKPSIMIEKTQLRTAKATGVSRSTVQEIKKEANRLDVAEGKSFSTPDKKKYGKHPNAR
jgi:hypothetical protein